MLLIVTACSITHAASTNDITSYVQRGLFEEEANHNLDAAMQAYQSAITLHDKDRKLAATAIFRLGECYRKQGKTNEANAYYKRIETEFADQKELADLSRKYLLHALFENLQKSQQDTSEGPESTKGQSAGSQTNNKALNAQLQSLSLEAAQAEALWKHVKDMNNDDRIRFFTTVQPDPTLSDLEKEFDTKQAQQRAETLVWGIEQKYKMLKEQEDALKARLGQSSSLLAKAKEQTTTSEEDEEIRKIKEMIQDSPDLINAVPERSDFTPLQSAALKGHVNVVEYLIANGAKMDGLQGEPPLLLAASHGHKAVVELLLAKGANVDASDREGYTALHAAAKNGFKAVAEVLIAHHANVNAAQQNGVTPLWFAAQGRADEIVKLLLANGADANSKGRNSTPLLEAARSSTPDIVQLLVAHQADINFQGAQDYTPLLTAARFGRVAIAQILLTNGANTEAQLSPEHTPQRYADGWQYSGFRAISFAIDRNDTNVLELLLRNHANPNSTFTWLSDSSASPGTTPLIMAVRGNKPLLAGILLKSGADINATDATGETALFYAVGWQQTNWVDLLLAHGANVNATDNLHRNPLFHAVNVYRPDTNIIATLIAHHADVNMTDIYGYTPIYHVMSSPPGTLLGTVREQLRNAGANENVVRLKQISVRQNGHESVVFTKGSNDWNHFTLLELISVVYGRNEPPDIYGAAGSESANPGQNRIGHLQIPAVAPVVPPSGYTGTAVPPVATPSGLSKGNFQFPDFTHVVIRRISQSQFKHQYDQSLGFNGDRSGEETVYNVDLVKILESGSAEKDWQLDWGDIVEIPESDHPLNATWQGIPSETQQQLMNLLSRSIKITIKGTGTNLNVMPPMPDFPNTSTWHRHMRLRFGENESKLPNNTIISQFGLRSVVNTANVLLSSSDTSRIKIIRGRSGLRALTLDLYRDPEPWIEPGDTIEIPDRDNAEPAK